MKKSIRKPQFWLLCFVLLLSISTACDKEDVMEEDPGQNPTTTEADPNKATASLVFDNMKTISGSPPVPGAITADLKINTDTIFWTEGVTNRIMVKRPQDVSLAGIWIFVAGSSSYIEATFREDEETEEIDILYFGFDPSEWELPVSFPIKITPFDEDGNALDEIEGPVVIEDPYDPSGGCFDYTSVKDEFGSTFWEWVFTEDKANDFFAAHMFPFLTNGTTQGCCVNGQSSQNINCPDEGKVELDYENYYTIARETFVLNNNIEFAGWSVEETRNFDPGESDFCSNKAGYNYDHKFSTFFGDWQVNEDCHLTFDYEGRDPFVYVGSKFKPISKHYIEEVRGGGPDGGGGLRRVYVMRTAMVKGEPVGPWYD